MKVYLFTFIAAILNLSAVIPREKELDNAVHKIPRVSFTGDQYAQMASAIYAETLQDMRNKIEYGSNIKFPAGFFHTSTEPKGVPQYYDDMWSRDCGRGVIELARLGFAYDSKIISQYFLSRINKLNHWGREMHESFRKSAGYEIDGNALVLSGICWTWRANSKDKTLGKEFCKGIEPVVNWIDSLMSVSPYRGLLPSISELSGNPSVKYPVYGIFGNYGIYVALKQIAEMASGCNQSNLADRAKVMFSKMEDSALPMLISDGHKSYASAGCWFNGIDGRSGDAYDISEWDGTGWPIWHWTRQLPFILDNDHKSFQIGGKFENEHRLSYELLRKYMIKGEYFRKYGFVSNTGWTGMGGRHDETMCGYGQGFFTQAALMADDVNVYTKCLEGIARLGYDGGVVEHMSYEKNPFLMHECFNYDNYEKGLDHTFGVHKEGRPEIMENPGDEGNLVQEAEIIKAFSIIVGAYCQGKKLILMPRLPWLWDKMECKDWPVIDQSGKIHRLQIRIQHERWLRRCVVVVSGAEEFESIDVRFGPFPRQFNNLQNLELEQSDNCTWIWKRDVKNDNEIVIEL